MALGIAWLDLCGRQHSVRGRTLKSATMVIMQLREACSRLKRSDATVSTAGPMTINIHVYVSVHKNSRTSIN